MSRKVKERERSPAISHNPIPIATTGTPEWHTSRDKLIGASEAGAACGLSDYAQPLDIYLRKRGEAEPFTGNRRTRRGQHNEPFILKEYCDERGVAVLEYPMPLFRHPQYPFMGATPDARLSDREGIEIKDISWRVRQSFGEPGTDAAPPDYVMQAQQQMAVMGWDCVRLVIMCEDELAEYPVQRNEELIRLIVDTEEELWARIVEGNPPEPIWNHRRTLELVKRIHGDIGAGVIELADLSQDASRIEGRERLDNARLDLQAARNVLTVAQREVLDIEDAAEWWTACEMLGNELKELKQLREEFQARVLHRMGDAYAAILPGGERMLRRKQIVSEVEAHTKNYVDLRVVKVPKGLMSGQAHP